MIDLLYVWLTIGLFCSYLTPKLVKLEIDTIIDKQSYDVQGTFKFKEEKPEHLEVIWIYNYQMVDGPYFWAIEESQSLISAQEPQGLYNGEFLEQSNVK